MKPYKKIKIQFLLAPFLCGCLLYGAFFFSRSLEKWRALDKTVALGREKVSKLDAIERKLAFRQRLVARLENFKKKAHDFGLIPEQWEQYDVQIQQPITFPQLSQVLEQTTTGRNYYFEPYNLYLSKSVPNEEGDAGTPGPPDRNSKPRRQGALSEGDVFLKLSGSFLVRK